MDMIEVRTSDLVGAALDWAVAKVEGIQVVFYRVNSVDPLPWVMLTDDGIAGREFYRPSTDWSQGGPLFDRHDILLGGLTGKPYAVVNNFPNGCGTRQNGPTKLIAACRAIVAANLGDVVQVPSQLVTA